ncbi:hypothetical protein WJ02_14625 [Burkholderia vietnamiensis]|nr:hypothetical protein WJ02_14625 [Burkholderia vietnamiensis]
MLISDLIQHIGKHTVAVMLNGRSDSKTHIENSNPLVLSSRNLRIQLLQKIYEPTRVVIFISTSYGRMKA